MVNEGPDHIGIKLLALNIHDKVKYSLARVLKWSTRAVCKTAGISLHRFEPYPWHSMIESEIKGRVPSLSMGLRKLLALVKKLVSVENNENQNVNAVVIGSLTPTKDKASQEAINHRVLEYIDLFEMSKDQADEFRERVAAWGGLIRIFVHPRFTKHTGPSFDNPHYPDRDERVFQGLMRLIGLPADRTPPILLLEQEGDDLRETKEAINLSLRDGNNQNVYVVETEWHNPYPKVEGGFVALKYKLEQLGVKRVIVAGIYMWIESDSKLWDRDSVQNANQPLFTQRQFLLGEKVVNKRYSYSGCAGYTLVRLAELGFKVMLSSFASPRNHRDVTVAIRNLDLSPVNTLTRRDQP